MLKLIRCQTPLPDGGVCGRFLGKINGEYEIKCPRCKGIQTNLHKPYNKVTGVSHGA